jgi:hypothetical protein
MLFIILFIALFAHFMLVVVCPRLDQLLSFGGQLSIPGRVRSQDLLSLDVRALTRSTLLPRLGLPDFLLLLLPVQFLPLGFLGLGLLPLLKSLLRRRL